MDLYIYGVGQQFSIAYWAAQLNLIFGCRYQHRRNRSGVSSKAE
ncbi:MAG: hypothetical protein O4861_09590 [Trichodesmium sp. St16_bin4-tuft]|nr:hypothetical protein [Trichodesmium sp. St16_bin4-tuft]